MPAPSDVSPYGVLRVGMTVDTDRHGNAELTQPLTEFHSFVTVPTAQGFTQGEGEFLGCKGTKGGEEFISLSLLL